MLRIHADQNVGLSQSINLGYHGQFLRLSYLFPEKVNSEFVIAFPIVFHESDKNKVFGLLRIKSPSLILSIDSLESLLKQEFLGLQSNRFPTHEIITHQCYYLC